MEYPIDKVDKIEDIDKKYIQFAIKRIFDIILSLIGIILLSPLLLFLFIWIRVDSKGGAVFRQKRIGKNNKEFIIYKFRTMVPNADKKTELKIDKNDLANFVFQSKSDSRITKAGSFLRKTSLDELPQLFNVLIGNMSLVGPRPEIPEVVQYYPKEYSQRLFVTPGITGLAQVSGRGEIELSRTVHYDIVYIKNFSVFYDIEILFKTVKSVLKRDGAF